MIDQSGPPPVREDYYQGGITLSFQPYLFLADGFYGVITSNPGSFKSAFVYFVLGGPLVTHELAQITDVTGGFGYNSNLKFLTVTNVVKFPFLQAASNTDPNTALTNLINSGWFFPQDGSFWLAAGLRLIAFELLQAFIIAVVEWNPNIYLGLFGVATADMPAGSGAAQLLHVELGRVATVDFTNGVVEIEDRLAPSSFSSTQRAASPGALRYISGLAEQQFWLQQTGTLFSSSAATTAVLARRRGTLTPRGWASAGRSTPLCPSRARLTSPLLPTCVWPIVVSMHHSCWVRCRRGLVRMLICSSTISPFSSRRMVVSVLRLVRT